MLVVRLIASLSVVALAGVTLRRLFSQRKDLQDALAASEERFVGSLSDIQKRRQAEALLFEEKERAQVTLASIADAVVTVDTAGRIEFMNPVAERLTGWRGRSPSAPGRRGVRRRRRSHRRADRRSRCARIERKQCRSKRMATSCCCAAARSRSPSTTALRRSATAMARTVGAVLVFQDMSRERQYAARLVEPREPRSADGPAQPPRVRAARPRAVEHAQRKKGNHAVLVPRPRPVQGRQRHLRSRRGRRAAAPGRRAAARRACAKATRSRGSAATSSACCSPHCPPAPALRIAEALRKAIVDFASVETALVQDRRQHRPRQRRRRAARRWASVLSAADVACYVAKDKGRNRVQVYARRAARCALRRGEMEWVNRLHRALAEERLCLYAQPMHAMHGDRHRRAAPGIARAADRRDGELIPPIAFIPAAERYHLMPAIDRWVIRTAFSSARRRRAAGDASRCGTTRSTCRARRSATTSSSTTCARSFARFRIPHASICFEITETTAVTSLSKAAEFIGAMREPGCRFALDDFGVGRVVVHVPEAAAGRLHQDRRQLRAQHAARSGRSLRWSRPSIGIGRVMGKQTIAESVETPRRSRRCAASASTSRRATRSRRRRCSRRPVDASAMSAASGRSRRCRARRLC